MAAAGWLAVAVVTLIAASAAALSRDAWRAAIGIASVGVAVLEVLAHAEAVAVAQLVAILVGTAATRIRARRPAAVAILSIWLLGAAASIVLLGWIRWPESGVSEAIAAGPESTREVLVNGVAPFAVAALAGLLAMLAWVAIAPKTRSTPSAPVQALEKPW